MVYALIVLKDSFYTKEFVSLILKDVFHMLEKTVQNVNPAIF